MGSGCGHNDVACIVVTYNSENHISQCLDAAYDAGVRTFVVVDNSPDSNTLTALKGWTSVDVQIVKSQENVGFGRANNMGASLCPPLPYLLLLNPDCRLRADTVDSLREYLESNPEFGAVAPAMCYPNGLRGIGGGGRPSVWKEILARTQLDEKVPRSWLVTLLRLLSPIPVFASMRATIETVSEKSALDVFWASGFCLLIRRDVWERTGGFDPRFFLYFEDVALCQIIRREGWRVGVVGSAEALHFESQSSTSSEKSEHYYRGFATYLKHYGTWTQRLFVSWFGRWIR